MGQKITISWAGVKALRDFAKAVPAAVEGMTECTSALVGQYQGLADGLGEIEHIVSDCINVCVASVIEASEAISDFPAILERTAKPMEDYLYVHPEIDGVGPSPDGDGAPHRGANVKADYVHTRR